MNRFVNERKFVIKTCEEYWHVYQIYFNPCQFVYTSEKKVLLLLLWLRINDNVNNNFVINDDGNDVQPLVQLQIPLRLLVDEWLW